MLKSKSVFFVLLGILLLGPETRAQLFQKWAACYRGPGGSDDGPEAISVGPQGDIYVTGSGSGLNTKRDYVTIKYDTDGNQLWAAHYDGPAHQADRGAAMVLDIEGNVYITGYSFGGNTDNDIATIKYDTMGNELWAKRYNGPANTSDRGVAIARDVEGNIIVAGDSYNEESKCDCVIIKYDAHGNELFVERYKAPENLASQPHKVAVDALGSILITGRIYDIGTMFSFLTLKLDKNGQEMWVVRYDSPESGHAISSSMAIDSQNNVYVTGYSNEADSGADFTTIKYDEDGNELWVARYNGTGNGFDTANAMVIDTNGNLYITGGSPGDGTETDFATVKYDASGNELWVARYNGSANGSDYGVDLAIDAEGNICVMGKSETNSGHGFATVKYDAQGNELSVSEFIAAGSDEDSARAIGADTEGNVFITGECYEDGTDMYTVKYSNHPTLFRRGEVNSDGEIDLSDAIFGVYYLFKADPAPECIESLDTDDSGEIDLTDVILLLNYLFLGDKEPAAPFQDCGSDSTEDSLSCRASSPCNP